MKAKYEKNAKTTSEVIRATDLKTIFINFFFHGLTNFLYTFSIYIGQRI